MPLNIRRRTRGWTLVVMIGAASWAAGLSAAPACCADELRDPFTFGPRTNAVGPLSGQTLVGILWDTAHPLAIIGDQTVGVGDVVSGWQVVNIQQNGVEVQRGDRRELLVPGNSLPSN